MIYPIEIKKWLELPVSQEVRWQVVAQKVNDMIEELELNRLGIEITATDGKLRKIEL